MTTLHRTHLVRPEAETLSMREYVDWRFLEFDKRNEQQRALLVTFNDERRQAMEARLDGLNHLQRRMDTLVSTFIPKPEYAEAHQRLIVEAQAESRRQSEALVAYGRQQDIELDALKKEIASLQRFQARLQGQILLLGVFASVLAFIVPFLVKAIGG